MSHANRLITIAFSHYNEKARWALQSRGVPFVEEPHLPIFHMPAVARAIGGAGRPDAVSSKLSTPVLVTATGPIVDSTDIVRYAEAHATAGSALIPPEHAEAVLALDASFGRQLGPATRCLGYYHLLPDAGLMRRLGRESVQGFEGAAWRLSYPMIAAIIRRALRVDARTAERARERILEAFDRVDSTLADGRRYLVGDRFTLADLSFAALAAPALLVSQAEGYAGRLPTRDEAPSVLRELADGLRARPAGELAIRVFADHRR